LDVLESRKRSGRPAQIQKRRVQLSLRVEQRCSSLARTLFEVFQARNSVPLLRHRTWKWDAQLREAIKVQRDIRSAAHQWH